MIPLAASTGTDLVLAFWAVLLLAAFFWGYNRWTNGRRWFEEESRRPKPVEPNYFREEIADHELLQQRSRKENALNAEWARHDLGRVA